MNVCIAVSGLDAGQGRRLREAMGGHEITFLTSMSEPEKRAAIAHAEIVFGNVPAAWLESAGRSHRFRT